uniref:Reverse transcriptase domain-containing protein n=1 Tax=Graphocephala atropunctata TaxID=36148 RepID=A0A1B6L7P7_9HEMI
MFKKSLEQGRMPDEFKMATVVPIFKAGDKSEVSSYRPISVISVIAKIFETIIKNKILDFFTQRSLFSCNQYGFIPGRGIDLAIEKHVSSIVNASDNYKYTVAVYLDFQKAFDVLDINVLLNKFEQYGFGGLALLWLKSFCMGRKPIVKINNVISNPLELYFGTAQGGVLGPIMFLVYINDLLDLDIYSTVFAYADDTALVCSAYNKQTLQFKIRKDLDKVSQWLSTNRLLINSSKSKSIIFYDYHLTNEYLQKEFNLMCHKHQCIYDCTCSNIEVVDYVKYLGMYIDKRLKWDHHINFLSSKLRKVNYVLYHLKGFVGSDKLMNVYISWFESLMRFGIIHYGGAYNYCLNSVIMNQRHAIRTIYSLKRMDRMSYLFREKNILTFEQLHKYSIILYVAKFIYQFEFREINRITRSSQQIHLKVPFLTKESSRHQFCYLGPRIYNDFLKWCGDRIIFEKKPKVKMKALEYLKNMPVD